MAKRVSFDDSAPIDAKVARTDEDDDFDDFDQYEGGDLPEEKRSGFFEEGVRFTPFNMRHEKRNVNIEEDFTFAMRRADTRDAFLEKDNWLDQLEQYEGQGADDSDDDNEDEEDAARGDSGAAAVASQQDRDEIFGQMAGLVRGDETVASAIKRLGRHRPAARVSRTRRALQHEEPLGGGGHSDEARAADMAAMLRLTGLANRAVNELDEYDIYSMTGSKLLVKVAGRGEVNT